MQTIKIDRFSIDFHENHGVVIIIDGLEIHEVLDLSTKIRFDLMVRIILDQIDGFELFKWYLIDLISWWAGELAYLLRI